MLKKNLKGRRFTKQPLSHQLYNIAPIIRFQMRAVLLREPSKSGSSRDGSIKMSIPKNPISIGSYFNRICFLR
jgi:hypothetical protein